LPLALGALAPAALWLVLEIVRFGAPFSGYGGEGFTHPLLGSCLSLQASDADRRLTHERLARAATDPEERAHHLVAAAGPPSESVASAIELGGQWAHARGAPWVAADLYEAAATNISGARAAYAIAPSPPIDA